MNILFMPVETSASNNVAPSDLNNIVIIIVCSGQCSMLLAIMNNLCVLIDLFTNSDAILNHNEV